MALVPSSPLNEQRCSRVGALALMALMLLGACAPVASPGGRLTVDRRWTQTPRKPSTGVAPGQQGEAVFARLPASFTPVQVEDAEFKSALVTWVLEVPLRVASPTPVRPGGGLAPGTGGSGEESWQSALARSYGQLCERRGTPGDCLTLLEDGPHLQADDKRGIALALAVGPALEGVDAEVRALLNPTRLLATVTLTLTGYMALLLAPEPVSKGVAAAFTVLLWGYLGWEFFDLIQAYSRLSEDAARATTFAELREAGERFGRVIGPNSVRVLVLVGTAAVGETASLLSRAPKLPGFGRASRTVEATTGLNLVEAATGTELVIVSVPEGTIRVVLAPHVVAMAGMLLPNGHRAWRSHSGIARALGSPGKGNQWHHIVEQTPGNVKRFGPEALHNTENVAPLEEGLHKDVSAFYSSIREGVTGSDTLTVRKWLGTQSYEAQRQFGLKAIENIRRGIWKVR